ncbi:uncharacterized protein V6R79_021372 [Siganus canaliculatus]
MSDIMINVNFSEDATQRTVAARNKKRKNKRFHKKMDEINRRDKANHRMRQSGPNHATRPAAADRSVPAAAPQCSSKPSTSTQSSSLTAAPGRDGGARPAQQASLSGGSKLVGPSKFLAIDCEMVGTGPQGRISQLARCSIVSYDGDVVYDKFIRPSVPVTDYRTRWSGIRPRDLANATPHVEARKEILRLLMGKVVIGHAIHNDFKALGYSHPTALTRDTSRIPLLNVKAGFGEHECASLKRLTKAIFNRDIQVGRKGHSSVEDAKATMELYKVVEVEWERELASRSS